MRIKTIEKWENRWRNLEGKAAWTRRVIKDLRAWTQRKHGEVNYYLTQFLLGHGAFNACLHRFKRRDSAEYIVATPRRRNTSYLTAHVGKRNESDCNWRSAGR